jgi:hypothetical protein
MAGNVPGDRKSPGQGGVYWRRRVIALSAGIALVGLVAWTVNGALSGGPATPSAQISRITASHRGQPTGAGGSAATPTPTPSPSASTAAGRPASRRPADRRPGHGGAARAGRAAGACPQNDIVLSLFTSRYEYPAHESPQFQVDVVSTAPAPCTFALGPGHVWLVVKAGGIHRVWDSADCAPPARPQVARLTRGVPAVLPLSWDRKASAPGCRAPRRPARAGTYTATAYSGRLSSRSLIFVLRAPGITVP